MSDKPRRRKKPFDPSAQPGVKYRGGPMEGPIWGVAQRAVLDGVPPMTYLDIPRLANDPDVGIGINMRASMVGQADWEVECEHPEAKAWIERTIRVCWDRIVPQMLAQYFPWGYSCCLPTFSSDDGFVELTGARMVTPMTGVPHIHTAGPYNGRFYGIDLQGHGEPAGAVVDTPWAMWYGGMERRCPLYDTSLYAQAWMPWLEKATRGGQLDVRRTFFRRSAVPLNLFRVPDGKVNNQADGMSWMDWAAQLVMNVENNDTLIVPDTRVPGIDGRSEQQWDLKQVGTVVNGTPILEYGDYLRREIFRGLGLPPEVLDSGESGSGYSGRQIPQQGLYTITDQLIVPLLDMICHCLLRELVPHNFGDGVKWRVTAVKLVEAIRKREQQGDIDPDGDGEVDPMEAMAAAAGGGPAEEVVDQGGGSPGNDPRASGLVPYVGPKGATGKKNTLTGQIYYDRKGANLSHEPGERPVGCLMAVIPEPLRRDILAFGRSIPEEELATDGRESDPHVTIKHGLTGTDSRPLFDRLSAIGGLSAMPGELGVFKSPDHDVLFVRMSNPGDFSAFREAVEGCDCVPETHPEYVPHATVAYLKPGCGSKYEGRRVFNLPVPVEELRYHSPTGRADCMTVWPNADQMKMAMGPVMMANKPVKGPNLPAEEMEKADAESTGVVHKGQGESTPTPADVTVPKSGGGKVPKPKAQTVTAADAGAGEEPPLPPAAEAIPSKTPKSGKTTADPTNKYSKKTRAKTRGLITAHLLDQDEHNEDASNKFVQGEIDRPPHKDVEEQKEEVAHYLEVFQALRGKPHPLHEKAVKHFGIGSASAAPVGKPAAAQPATAPTTPAKAPTPAQAPPATAPVPPPPPPSVPTGKAATPKSTVPTPTASRSEAAERARELAGRVAKSQAGEDGDWGDWVERDDETDGMPGRVLRGLGRGFNATEGALNDAGEWVGGLPGRLRRAILGDKSEPKKAKLPVATRLPDAAMAKLVKDGKKADGSVLDDAKLNDNGDGESNLDTMKKRMAETGSAPVPDDELRDAIHDTVGKLFEKMRGKDGDKTKPLAQVVRLSNGELVTVRLSPKAGGKVGWEVLKGATKGLPVPPPKQAEATPTAPEQPPVVPPEPVAEPPAPPRRRAADANSATDAIDPTDGRSPGDGNEYRGGADNPERGADAGNSAAPYGVGESGSGGPFNTPLRADLPQVESRLDRDRGRGEVPTDRSQRTPATGDGTPMAGDYPVDPKTRGPRPAIQSPVGQGENDAPADPNADDHSAHTAKAHATLVDIIQNSEGLSDEQKKTFADSMRKVIGNIPASAHRHLGGLTGVSYHADPKAVGRAVVADGGVSSDKAKRFLERGLGGLYRKGRRSLFLDGAAAGSAGRYGGVTDQSGPEHVHGHEVFHAIDHAMGGGGKAMLSDSPEWGEAVRDEIMSGGNGDEAPLTEYARVNPAEAFSEVGRVLSSGAYDLEQFADRFPKVAAFFKSHGLWPDKGGTAEPDEFPEVFDKDARVEMDRDGSHADVLLEKNPDEGGSETQPPEEPTRPDPSDKPVEHYAKLRDDDRDELVGLRHLYEHLATGRATSEKVSPDAARRELAKIDEALGQPEDPPKADAVEPDELPADLTALSPDELSAAWSVAGSRGDMDRIVAEQNRRRAEKAPAEGVPPAVEPGPLPPIGNDAVHKPTGTSKASGAEPQRPTLPTVSVAEQPVAEPEPTPAQPEPVTPPATKKPILPKVRPEGVGAKLWEAFVAVRDSFATDPRKVPPQLRGATKKAERDDYIAKQLAKDARFAAILGLTPTETEETEQQKQMKATADADAKMRREKADAEAAKLASRPATGAVNADAGKPSVGPHGETEQVDGKWVTRLSQSGKRYMDDRSENGMMAHLLPGVEKPTLTKFLERNGGANRINEASLNGVLPEDVEAMLGVAATQLLPTVADLTDEGQRKTFAADLVSRLRSETRTDGKKTERGIGGEDEGGGIVENAIDWKSVDRQDWKPASEDETVAFKSLMSESKLTPQQSKVMGLLADGKNPATVAAELEMTPGHVKTVKSQAVLRMRVFEATKQLIDMVGESDKFKAAAKQLIPLSKKARTQVLANLRGMPDADARWIDRLESGVNEAVAKLKPDPEAIKAELADAVETAKTEDIGDAADDLLEKLDSLKMKPAEWIALALELTGQKAKSWTKAREILQASMTVAT